MRISGGLFVVSRGWGNRVKTLLYLACARQEQMRIRGLFVVSRLALRWAA